MRRLALCGVLLGMIGGFVAAQRPDDKPMPMPDAEKLPEMPKADPKSEVTPLTKEQTLVIEKKPDGKKRVLFVAEVCLREGPLEVFLCKTRTKEHEAVARTEIDARLIHAALLAIGVNKGSPVQYSNPKTGDAEYKAATGGIVNVSVHYTLKGKTHEHTAQDWILDVKTKKTMAHQWVFAGSRFAKNPDRPEDPEYYCANNGEMIGISNFPDSMLDLPVEIG
ncbi:MAG: YdjY domain-containing protein, partial [Gemmataceae bacterium]